MAYTLNKTDGTTLVTLEDGTIDITTTDVALFGKGYAGFGERLNENTIKILENFSNTTAPKNNLKGQLWYDSLNNQLNVYTGSKFKPVGSSTNSGTQPTGSATGDTWFDTSNNQLYVYNGSNWILIGPTTVAGSGVTQVVSDTIADTTGVNRSILKFTVNDIVVAIVSQSQFTPATLIDGFSTIFTGVTMNSLTLSGAKLVGTSTDSDKLDGNLASTFLNTTGGTISGNLVVQGNVTVGASSEITQAVSGGEFTVTNSSNNGDIVFKVNNAGTPNTEAMRIDAQNNTVRMANLEITGTQTVVNTSTLTVEDNILELNRNISSAASMPSYSGIKVNRGVSSSATEQNLYFVWDETYADDGTTIYGNAGGAWTAFKASQTDTELEAPTLVDIRANVVHATSTSAQYADLAERYETDMRVEPGDLVMLGGEKQITKTTQELSEQVFGVISTKPAFLMDKDAGNDETHPAVVLKGKAPVKVIGTGKKGDRIVSSSIKGVARVADIDEITPYMVVGRLLSDKYNNNIQAIECVIGVK